MRTAGVWMRVSALTLMGCCLGLPVSAEDVENKFRIGLGLGFLDPQDSVPSPAANALGLADQNLMTVDFYRDPRNDSGAFGELELVSGPLATLFGQYAVNKIFVVELSAGYQKTDLGDVEVQAQFDGVDIPDLDRFLFTVYRIPVGEVEQIPLKATFLARFRPRSSFNPYFGGGFGYTFLGFEPKQDFNQLSVNMDASQGARWRVTSAYFGNETIVPTQDAQHDLDGARVDVSDTWEWHLAGGAELSFKRKWALFLDLKYSFSARNVEIGFDGARDLGGTVPNLVDFCANEPLSPPPGGDLDTVCPGSEAGREALAGAYGPMRVSIGGLIDGGRLVPEEDAPRNTDCSDPGQAADCVFVFEPDGQVDRGFYYAQGGTFKLDAFSVLIGVRYTF